MSEIAAKIKKAQYANIIKKASSGKVLTEKELQQINEYEDSAPIAAINAENPFLMPTNLVAAFFDVTTMTLTNWQKMGLPKISRGKYDLRACFRWWDECVNKPKTKKEEKAREIYWQAKAEREQISVKQLSQTVMSREEVEAGWTFRLKEMILGLESIPAIFPDKSQERKILNEYIYRLLDNYARAGKYMPVVMPELKTIKKKKRNA
jgi:phage terminase Nu1 subunit (DNA packaging protein)